ncbi:hypothetical protein [Pseudomonas sp. 2FG]|uniref:hypothetical protein n=1 Tax=Pseudomonas sp. 2FG TaxID=2502191 RepID=UPI002115B7B1
MTSQDTDDRREYYRIDDPIALEFSQLSGANALASEALNDASPLCNPLGDPHLSDFESQHLATRQRDDNVAPSSAIGPAAAPRLR